MYGSHDPQDAQVDRNLRRIGPQLALPAAPTDAQRTSWLCREPAPVRNNRKERLMWNIRMFTAGSIAAALAVAVFLFGPFHEQRVEAATIISSLKTSAWRTLRVTFEKVEVEGIAINGEAEVRFCQPTSFSELVKSLENDHGDSNPAHSSALDLTAEKVESVYFDLDVRAGPDAEDDVAGLDVMVRGGWVLPSEAWLFCQLRQLPAEVLRESPEAQLIVMLLGKGVMLDLNGMDDWVGKFMDDVGEDDRDEADPPAAADAGAVQVGVKVQASAKADDSAAEAIEPEAAHAAVAGDSGVELEFDGMDEADKLLLNRVLSGRATASELEQLLAGIDHEGADLNIEARGNGLHVLTASNFEDDDEFMQHARVEVAYQEGAGVQWLAVNNVGPHQGAIRIDFVEGAPGRVQNERQRMIDLGVQPVAVEQLMQMLGSFGGGANVKVKAKSN